MSGTPFELNIPPGIVADDSTFGASGAWADGDGFRFVQGRPETVGRAVEMTNSTTISNVTKMLVYDAAGTIKLATAGNTLQIAEINTAATDITPASGWTAGNIRRSLHMFGNILLASCTGGTLFESSGAQAMTIGNAPDNITCFVVTPSRQVMALGCNEEGSGTFNARCIRWCEIEDYTDWTTTSTNNAGEYVLPGQADIVGGTVFGDYILIWTEAAVWVARFIGDPSETFSFECVGIGGLCGPDAFAVLQQVVYWVGREGEFYAYSAGGLIEKVTCPLSSQFNFIAAGSSARESVFACPHTQLGEVWYGWGNGFSYLAYCADESRRAQRHVWFKGSFRTAFDDEGASASALVESSLQWDPQGANNTSLIVHRSGGKPWRWDCDTTSGANPVGIAGSYIQTSDLYIDQGKRRVMVTGCIPDYEQTNGLPELTIYTRDRPVGAVTTNGPYVLPGIFSSTWRIGTPPSSGGTSFTLAVGSGGIPAGVRFTVLGVNEYDGGDTGELMVFALSQDFPGYLPAGVSNTLNFTPAMISSGASQNVTALPLSNAIITFLDFPSKKDFRASGKLIAFRFAMTEERRVRLGKPVFDVIPLGMR